MSRQKCTNNSEFFASYINAPPPSDLPIPKFEEKIFIVTAVTAVTAVTDKQIRLKTETRNPPREKKNRRRRKRKTIKKGE